MTTCPTWLLHERIVLVAVNVAAQYVLLMIDLAPLVVGEVAAVPETIARDLVIEPRLFILEPPCFARGELTRGDALRDPVLLISPPGVNLPSLQIRRNRAAYDQAADNKAFPSSSLLTH